MTPAARLQTASELLDVILAGEPAEKVLTGWARASRFAGSKDRAAVRDHVYEALRRKRSLALRGGAMTGRGLMIGLLRQDGADVDALFTGKPYAPAPLSDAERSSGQEPEEQGDKLDLPDWLIPELRDSLGDALSANAEIMKARAPVVLRANLRKADRAMVRDLLAEEGIETCDHPLSTSAIEVREGGNKVARCHAYLDGLVEIQDASSQAAVDTLPLKSNLKVLDYCAGGGGKLLAIGGRVEGHFFAHDVDRRRMADLPARANRAGLRVRILDKAEIGQQAPFDLVFCDVPCSGSGTWRRTPDAKWRFTPERLAELNRIQDQILREAEALVAPGGTLAYATCSLLKAENQGRIDAFLAEFPDWQLTHVESWELTSGGDGFYTAHLTRLR